MRRHDGVTAVDSPLRIVEHELWRGRDDVHVRFPKALDRPDVFPVSLEGVRKHRLPAVDDRGDDVVAEVVGGIRIFIVDAHAFFQRAPIEDVDAHRSLIGLWLFGFFFKRCDTVRIIGVHDAEAVRFLHRNRQNRDGRHRIFLDMKAQHCAVVHLIDMIAGKD
ncbi:hypothetical protein SDC9_164287 [bioreactor metagenome]|uniref:Uncharacterized protein n=1 Tax=bioreactor metagenome TaxID=1076179 RepID=A0A645FR52_9ZZZZ